MITAATCLYAVIGNPVGHSLSPVMHNKAFEVAGIDGVYVALEVSDLAGAVDAIRTLGIQGVSVTIPHKVAVMAFLDGVDALAARIGAVNTIVNRSGGLWGSNSDASGAVDALSEAIPVKGKTALVIGAGGAARAVAFGIREAGAHVTVANRSAVSGEHLAADLGVAFTPLGELKHGRWEILINTTPVGMVPHIAATPVPASMLTPEMTVMDVVYTPMQTRLLALAAQRGCRTVNGVSMFVRQGAVQFELWTGKKAPLAAMKQVVVAALDHEA